MYKYSQMNKYLKKLKTYLIIITFFYLSLIVSFFLNEDSSGGAQADFFTTQHLIKKISEDFLLGIIDWKNSSLSHFPLHYVVSAIFVKFLTNIDIVRFKRTVQDRRLEVIELLQKDIFLYAFSVL